MKRTSSSTWSEPDSRSVLFSTITTLFPQPRSRSMNWRSLSVKGRSAEVTNSTRSARGAKRSVISSWRRMIALVPGVSTIEIIAQEGRGVGALYQRPRATTRSPRVSP